MLLLNATLGKHSSLVENRELTMLKTRHETAHEIRNEAIKLRDIARANVFDRLADLLHMAVIEAEHVEANERKPPAS